MRDHDPDAPTVPAGLRPRMGVEFGCGVDTCVTCYEPQCLECGDAASAGSDYCSPSCREEAAERQDQHRHEGI